MIEFILTGSAVWLVAQIVILIS